MKISYLFQSHKVSLKSFVATVLTVAAMIALSTGAAQATLLVYTESTAIANGTNVDEVYTQFTSATATEAGASTDTTTVSDIKSQANASTDYRVNKALATTSDSSSNTSDTDTNRGVSAQGQSYWQEGLTLVGAGPSFEVSFLFELSGTLGGKTQSSSVNFDFVFDVFDDSVGGMDTVSFFSNSIGSYNEMLMLVVDFQVASAIPIYISADLWATAGTGKIETGSSLSDFFGTALLTQVIIPDGKTLISESGTDYSTILTGTPTTVPEPTTLALFGFGLAGLGFMRRRRKAA